MATRFSYSPGENEYPGKTEPLILVEFTYLNATV